MFLLSIFKRLIEKSNSLNLLYYIIFYDLVIKCCFNDGKIII